MDVCAIIERETGQSVTADTPIELMAKDSLEFLSIIVEIEKESGREFPGRTPNGFRTVGELQDYFQ